jgi:outer membrane scaffolding protein for murein synthesis (MipA/OmpV family)
MPISDTVIAGATASYEDFAQEIENSPLISATGQSQAGIFLLKAF